MFLKIAEALPNSTHPMAVLYTLISSISGVKTKTDSLGFAMAVVIANMTTAIAIACKKKTGNLTTAEPSIN
jgi:hypothetical protein